MRHCTPLSGIFFRCPSNGGLLSLFQKARQVSLKDTFEHKINSFALFHFTFFYSSNCQTRNYEKKEHSSSPICWWRHSVWHSGAEESLGEVLLLVHWGPEDTLSVQQTAAFAWSKVRPPRAPVPIYLRKSIKKQLDDLICIDFLNCVCR